MEIYDRCLSRKKCNCGQLCVTGFLLVSSTNRDTCLAPVADRSAETLLAIVKSCILPGTTVVSDCWGYNVRLCNDGLLPLHQSLCEFRGTWMLTNTIKPTWMHVKVNL